MQPIKANCLLSVISLVDDKSNNMLPTLLSVLDISFLKIDKTRPRHTATKIYGPDSIYILLTLSVNEYARMYCFFTFPVTKQKKCLRNLTTDWASVVVASPVSVESCCPSSNKSPCLLWLQRASGGGTLVLNEKADEVKGIYLFFVLVHRKSFSPDRYFSLE